MKNRRFFTKFLAILGTVLVLLPTAAMIVFSALRFIQGGHFQIDYLLPAEAFLITLVGSGLLIWGARRAKAPLKLILLSLAAAVGVIVTGQAIASLTGLASGEIEPEGWPWALVFGAIVLFDLLIVVVGVGGILLIRDLFTKDPANNML